MSFGEPINGADVCTCKSTVMNNSCLECMLRSGNFFDDPYDENYMTVYTLHACYGTVFYRFHRGVADL